MRIRIVAGVAVAVCALATGCANTVAGTGLPGPAPAGGQTEQSQPAPSPIGGNGPDITSSETTVTPEPTASRTSSPVPGTSADLPSLPATTVVPDTSGADTAPTTTIGGATEADDATAVNPSDFPGTVTEYGFQSPSGNITCGISDHTAVCQIQDYTYTPPAGDCGDSGWGFNFRVSPGKPAELFCAGDVESGGPTLDYGRVLDVGGVSCASAETGVTCTNLASGNGFRLSKVQYSLFTPEGEAPASAGGDAAASTAEPSTAEPSTAKPSTAKPSTAKPPGIPSAITGEWNGHGRGLKISAAGHGVLDYRTYRFCSDDPTTPCDSVDGNTIDAGGHIEFTLDTATGEASASGSVTVSNDPATAIDTPITATATDGLLELSIWPDSPFCGSESPVGACGA